MIWYILIVLLFTVPSTDQLRWIEPGTDSVHVECSGGPATADVESIRVYKWNVTGGLARHVMSKYVGGKEGLEDSIDVDTTVGGHFWVTAVDTAGNESCTSPVVYIGPVTGVGQDAYKNDPITYVRIFDVHGRYLGAKMAKWGSGVYFVREVHRSGREVTRRTVILK